MRVSLERFMGLEELEGLEVLEGLEGLEARGGPWRPVEGLEGCSRAKLMQLPFYVYLNL